MLDDLYENLWIPSLYGKKGPHWNSMGNLLQIYADVHFLGKNIIIVEKNIETIIAW
jgi:hypothetical protein